MAKLIPWFIAAVAIAVAVGRRLRSHRAPRVRNPLLVPAFLNGTTALIAAREIRQRMRGRMFRVITLLMLIGVAAAVVIPTLTKGGRPVSHVGVVGQPTASERAAVTALGTSLNVRIDIVDEPNESAARADLLAGNVNVALINRAEVLTKKALTAGQTTTTARVAHAIAAAVGEQEAYAAAGLTPAQQRGIVNAKPLPIAGLQPAPGNDTARTTAVVGVILLFVMLTQYNTWILTGVMEEKSSRVVEVLLAAVRPAQLLAGKVVGIATVVFAQAALVVGTALALGAAVGSDILKGAAPTTVISMLVWLVLGYAFYSWVYAAAGSMAERQDQVQGLVLPLMAPMLLGYILALTVAGRGTSTAFFDVLAYLPPTAPFAMPILVAIGDATWWQFAISAVITVASTFGVARLASLVYRRAVLRTGRRVHLREVFAHPRA
jgi:ABC-2 type transport system permease protein